MSKKLKTFKKSLSALMVAVILFGTLGPAPLIFAENKKMGDTDLALEKLESKRLEKAEQLKGSDDGKMKTFSADEGLKKTTEIKQPEKPNYVPGEVLVKFKSQKINLEQSSGRIKAKQFAVSKSLDKKEDIRKSNISVLKIKDTKTVEEKIAELKNDPQVEYAEPNYKRYPSTINTNDTYKDLLWGLDNVDDKDIDAPEAWAISEGAESEEDIIVAVIDSGVAYNHPDLADNMWNGNACLDDSGNYLGGCNHGYDYGDNDPTPLPTCSSHGTHIAGTIGAVKNNGTGIIGIAPNVKIMALKFGFDVGSEIKAINFAIQNGAKVINASFGGSFSQLEYNAIISFKDAGGIFITAAGNGDGYGDPNIGDNHNESGISLYPCDYDINNIICVAATDQNDEKVLWSDYGTISVDVGAPGVNIYSAVADSVVLNETFENVTTPDVPIDWIKTDNWGTYDLGDGIWNKVLYGDINYPYADNANSKITSPVFNLNGASGADINFWTKCDTEYSTSEWTDYMALEISSDGNSFAELDLGLGNGKFDEATLDIFNGESPLDSSGGAIYHFKDISIPNEYLTNNFKFRFRWETNSSDNYYDGCWIDNIKIKKYTDGSDENYDYGYKAGTSMAVPHVAGLAALIWGYKSELSYSEVKDVILNTGESLDSLAGKTTTGKRINAHSALLSLMQLNVTIDKLKTNDTTPELTGTIDDNDALITVTVNGEMYNAVNNSDGTWTLADNTINELNIGIYDIEVRAEKSCGTEYDNTKDELVITLTGEKPPFAVAIDNQKNGRPVSGVDEADVVYEFPVEGSITRFMAIYNPDSEISPATQIGPVRSARPYFARTASEHKSIYAHAGGIPTALQSLNNHEYSVYNLDALTNDDSVYFWRDETKSAPHNLYTSIENLNSFRDEFELGTGIFTQPWIFSDTPYSIENIGFDQTEVEIKYTNENYNVKWIYDNTDGVYYRQTYEDENYQDYIDINNNQVSTVNLAVQYADTNSFTEIIQTEGNALLCREGKCINGRWEKDNVDSNVKFYINGNEEFEFKTGKLWVNITSIEAPDHTAPEITGLSNDDMPTQSKTWNWDSSDTTAKFKYAITKSIEQASFGDYGDIKTATQDTGNGIYWLYVQAIDEVGNESNLTLVSAVLDNASPTATISYDITDPTNTDVVATMIPSESVTVTNNEGLLTYTFTENGSFTFEFIDTAGNIGSAIANVNNINKVAPIVEITSPANGLVTNQLTITIEYTADGTPHDNTEDLSEGINTVVRNVTDDAGNVGSDSIMVTLDTTPPVCSDGSPTGALSAGTTQTTLSLTTDEDATCKYSTTANIEYSETIGIFDTTGETDHSTLITGLTNGNSYTYYIRCQDIFGAKNTNDYEISFSVASPPAGGGGGGGSYTPSSVLSSNNPLRVLSTQKGTLNQNLNNENKVKVEIPKGSIKSTTTFTASEGSLKEGDIPKDKIGAFLFNGLVFNIEAIDLSNNAVREFSEDLTITLTVPDLPDDTSGLELYYFDDESGEWVIITDIEFGDGIITFKVNHLTLFALFEISEPIVKGVGTVELFDGDVVRVNDDEKVYVIKIIGDKKFKRHIVSPKVFNSYGHLNWDMIKSVSSLDDYSLSAWVRNCTGPNGTPSANDKVYEINGDSTMHWLNMTAQQFYARGGSDEAIYNINDGELGLYALGVDVMYQ